MVVLLRSNAKFDRLENLLPLPLPETVRRQICLPVAVSASSESTDLSDVSATGDSESSVRHKNNSSLNCICGTINSIELKLNFFFFKRKEIEGTWFLDEQLALLLSSLCDSISMATRAWSQLAELLLRCTSTVTSQSCCCSVESPAASTASQFNIQ